MFKITDAYGKSESVRVKSLYDELNRTQPRVDSQRAVLYTEYMEKHSGGHSFLKTAEATRHVLSCITPVIFDNELLVGSLSRYPLGAQVYPEIQPGKSTLTLEGSASSERQKRLLCPCLISHKDLEGIEKAQQYWRGKDLLMPGRDYGIHADNQFSNRHDSSHQPFLTSIPEQWLAISYETILRQGIDSIIASIREFTEGLSRKTNPYSAELDAYLGGIICILEGIVCFAKNYATEAQRMAKQCPDPKRKKELTEIARICTKVPRKAPDTFREALQAFWFVHVCACLESPESNASPGRFDQYLDPYLERDLSEQILSVKGALELLELMRIKCEGIITVYKDSRGSFFCRRRNQHITLAGSDSHGNPCDTLLSKFLLQARIHIHTEQPVLAIRWREDLSDFFKHKVIDCIKTAGWCPDIYHEHIGTNRCSSKTCMPAERLHDWIIFADPAESHANLQEATDLLFRKNQSKIFDILLNSGDFSAKDQPLKQEDSRKRNLLRTARQYYRLICRAAMNPPHHACDVLLGPNNTGIVHPWLCRLNQQCETTSSPSCRYSSIERISTLSLIDLAKAITVLRAFLSKEALFTLSEIREAIETDFEGTETLRQMLLGEASLSSQNPLFEETLIELLDIWACFAYTWRDAGSVEQPGIRRFTLIRGAIQRVQPSCQ